MGTDGSGGIGADSGGSGGRRGARADTHPPSHRPAVYDFGIGAFSAVFMSFTFHSPPSFTQVVV